MKRFFALLILLSTPFFGQEKPVTVVNDSIYTASTVDVKPEYPGGLEAFYDFVSKNIVLPVAEKDIRVRVYMSFIIETDGSISNVKSHRDPGYGLDKEAVRLVGLSGKWIPGEKDGKKVRTSYNLPINVQLKAMPPPPQTQAADVKPEYPGGLDAFYTYIRKNLYLKDVKGISTIRIFALFTVEADGSMTNIKMLRDPGQGIGDRLVKVLKECPEKWVPAKMGNENVSYSYSLPITINLK